MLYFLFNTLLNVICNLSTERNVVYLSPAISILPSEKPKVKTLTTVPAA